MSLIRKLIEKAAKEGRILERSKESMRWFAERTRRLAMTPGQFVRNESDVYTRVNRGSVGAGRMYTYFYDPKHKATLPFYDRFPCIFILEMYSDGWLGLNLHYLSYAERATLLDALLEYENDARIPANKKLRISYSIIASFGKSHLAKHCVKRYLKNHVRSKLMKIDAEYWPIVAMLPTQEFDGKDFSSMRQVWRRKR